MSENKVIWHPIEEGYPPEVDEVTDCLVSLKSGNIRIALYSEDLYKFDKHYFSDYKNLPKEERKGFLGYGSEFGYYIRNCVIAWAYLPEPYKDTQTHEGD